MMEIDWEYHSNKQKPIIYVGSFNTASNEKIIIQDDTEFEYVGIYKVDDVFYMNHKKVKNSLIKRRLNKIIKNNFTQVVKDFLDKKDYINTIL